MVSALKFQIERSRFVDRALTGATLLYAWARHLTLAVLFSTGCINVYRLI